MALALLGMGTALPSHRLSQADAAELISRFFCETPEQARLLPGLFARTEVQARHSVLLNGSKDEPLPFYPAAGGASDHGPTTAQRMQRYAAEAYPLALRAARQALHQSQLSAVAITHLVTISCTGFAAPGIDVDLLRGLELSPGVERT